MTVFAGLALSRSVSFSRGRTVYPLSTARGFGSVFVVSGHTASEKDEPQHARDFRNPCIILNILYRSTILVAQMRHQPTEFTPHHPPACACPSC